MFCAYCRSKNPDGDRFCKQCGAQLEFGTVGIVGAVAIAAPAQFAVAKSRTKLPIVITAVAVATTFVVLAVILLLFVLSNGGRPFGNRSEYAEAKMSVNSVYSKNHNCTIFTVNGEVLDKTIPGSIHDAASNQDFSKLVISSTKGGVYVVSADGIVEISDEGDNVAISFDGSQGLYTCEDGLYLFDSAGKSKPDKISNDEQIDGSCFSPDGKTLVYSVTTELDGSRSDSSADSRLALGASLKLGLSFETGSNAVTTVDSTAPDVVRKYELKIYKNGKVEVLESDAIAISTSNGGEIIYFVRPSNKSLYVTSAKTGDTSRIANKLATYNIIVNNNSTEIIYTTKNGTYYIDEDGKKHEIGDVAKSNLALIMPRNTPGYTDFNPGVSSLKNKVYVVEDELVYLDKDAKVTSIATGVEHTHMSNDGKTLYYTKKDRLYRVDVGTEAKSKKLADDVSDDETRSNFAISDDQQHIYFIDSDDNLQYINSDGQSTRIKSEVRDIYMLSNGRLCFVAKAKPASSYFSTIESDAPQLYDLYYSQNGADAVKVETDVCSMFGNSLGKCLGYQTDTDNGDVYFIYVDNDDPVKLADGPAII